MKQLKPIAGVVLGLVLSGCAVSSEDDRVPPDALTAAIQKHDAKIVRSFDAGDGLTGWVIDDGRRDHILYTSPSGEYVIAGQLWGKALHPVTQSHEYTEVPRRDFSAFWDETSASTFIPVGAEHPSRIVYVFLDPYCPVCHRLYGKLSANSDRMKANGVSVRYLLTGIIHPLSEETAALILSQDDKAAALDQALTTDTMFHPAREATVDAATTIGHHKALMEQLRLVATPALFYKGEDGKAYVSEGMPVAAEEKAIFGFLLDGDEQGLERK